MKHLKLTLLSVLTSVSSLYAQEFYPSYRTNPQAGFDSIQEVSPYVIMLESSGAQGDEWSPNNRSIQQWSNKVPFLEKIIRSTWDNDSWSDYYVSKDSFLFDNQNNIITDYKYSMFTYNNNQEINKYKYDMTYNQQNQLTSATFYSTNPSASNNYQKYLTYYYFYDAEGKKMLDSANYENASYPDIKTHYLYNPTGKLSAAYTVTLTGDSTNKLENVYDASDRLLSTTSSSFNSSIDEWSVTYTDTFQYNPLGQVNRRVTYGQMYMNGVLSFGPFRNEFYTYNTAGNLQTVVEKELNQADEWVDSRKIVLNYATTGKLLDALVYPSTDGNGNWSTIATFKYVFETMTSLPKTKHEPVIESFYPNPVQQGTPLTVEMRKTASFQLVDIQGKHIFRGILEIGKNEIPTTLLQKGIYFMHVDGEALATKVIVD